MYKKTDREIREAFLNLAEKLPLEKIKTADICSTAEVSKQTFYNHYRDKYDVIAKIFITDMYSIDDSLPDSYSKEKLTAAISKIFEKKTFYKKAFNLETQNSLIDSIDTYDYEINRDMMKRYYGIDELTEEMDLAIRYHSIGCIWLISDILTDGTPITAKQLADI